MTDTRAICLSCLLTGLACLALVAMAVNICRPPPTPAPAPLAGHLYPPAMSVLCDLEENCLWCHEPPTCLTCHLEMPR